MKQKNVMRGLAGLSATLLAISGAATAVASTRADLSIQNLEHPVLSWLKKEMERAIPFILIRNFPLFRI